ncbi:hypothetical protein GA0115240_11777 [Streptomyces sp. DvalAA-14]|nr:hypothetical protein GA0115240_11777 [Streptomyces sp. DvalAA-14]
MYYFQDDSNENRMVEKGLRTRPDGSQYITGTTSDFIRVEFRKGVPVSVVSVDVTKAEKNLEGLKSTVANKLPTGNKEQAEEVIVHARSADQAAVIAKFYEGRSDVRVMHPESGFDSGRISTGPLPEGVHLPKTLGVIGDMAFALDYPVNIYGEGLENATGDLINGIGDPFGIGLGCVVTGCGPAPVA